MDPRFQHPFTCVIAIPTRSGKTVFLNKLLTHARVMIHEPPEAIVWFYGEYQPLYDQMFETLGEIIRFVEGVPQSFDDFIDKSKRNLIILDDLMSETANDKTISNLFTKGSHHKNVSVILVSQNLFHRGRENRTISLNTVIISFYSKTLETRRK
ncbi:hypothetical protein HOLleu_34609 [Holothuria leucospilota]|uniref:Uncharacterized protein n=1 Tax=Holothuria leucospilota TaxID=206669 RepID=A0A9Q1BGU6_HOLLE|nr:hypothetical protein HOLleu_34609 [Holothuria leucospilota]